MSKSMLQINPPHFLPFFLLLLLTTATTTSTALSFFFSSYSQYKTVVSLSHSLLTRVSNLRAARGDVASANRTKLIAENLEKGLGLGFLGLARSAGWDYAKNYAGRDLDYRKLCGIVSDFNELARFLGKFTRAESKAERATWIASNYSNILRLSKSVLQRFQSVSQSGALKETAEMMQREVVDGGLLGDCLESGSDDLKGLVQMIKYFGSQFYYSTSDYRAWSVGWDYAKNYAWRDLDYRKLYSVVSDFIELARILGELTQTESKVEKATWIARNYSNILWLSKSVLQRFLSVSQSGALKETAEMVRREVVDIRLLRDCLELGSDDLKGLVQMIKDLGSQFYYSTSDYKAWSVGWDYGKNYPWRDLDYRKLYGVVSDFKLSKPVLQRFLSVSQSGALKKTTEMGQREVVDVGLLRDCLESGRDDLKSLVQMIKDLGSQFYYSTYDYKAWSVGWDYAKKIYYSTSDYNSEL